MSQVVFDMNLEAELLGECVPKLELGNEDVRPFAFVSTAVSTATAVSFR